MQPHPDSSPLISDASQMLLTSFMSQDDLVLHFGELGTLDAWNMQTDVILPNGKRENIMLPFLPGNS